VGEIVWVKCELHCVLRLQSSCYICKRELHIQEIVQVLIPRRAFCHIEGSTRHTGTSLTVPPLAPWATHRVSCGVTSVFVRWAASRG
jgi:hypothetical protein